ncbi:LOW QUALITY PROTEIN: hypothetical protein Cgig2_017108 [Carnegiea gigantea]|uniref:Uncharacterized protein n=1 Tax=Carnegiea gigantea TaxID=171969 RepID=A0A9Q1GW37_9CARY|nr:LOW QUALITY PROTEIN: hypothetical protein Cgig2_017108 [Carnegiea gigantea]
MKSIMMCMPCSSRMETPKECPETHSNAGGKCFKKNFIIYLVNYFFSGPKSHYCSKSILKYIKYIASLDWCQFVLDKLITSVRHYKESTATKGSHTSTSQTNGEAEIPGDTLISDVSIIVEKEDHREDVVLDQLRGVTKKEDSIPSSSLGLGLSQSYN